MKKLLSFTFLVIVSSCFGQSKQEQIDLLTKQIDSLKRVNFEQELILKKVTYDKDELPIKRIIQF